MSNPIKTTALSLDGADYLVVETDAQTIFVYRGHEISADKLVHPMSPVRRKVLEAYKRQ